MFKSSNNWRKNKTLFLSSSIIIFIFGSLYSHATDYARDCIMHFLREQKVKSHFGAPLNSPPSLGVKFLEGTKTYFLGSGVMEYAKVYRILEPGRAPYILKIYDELTVFKNDLKSFQIIREIITELNDPILFVAHSKNLSDITEGLMIIENIEGKTIYDIANDLNDEDRTYFLTKISKLIAKITKAIFIKYPDATQSHIGGPILVSTGETKTFVRIKLDNIVYSPKTEVFTIIDPY